MKHIDIEAVKSERVTDVEPVLSVVIPALFWSSSLGWIAVFLGLLFGHTQWMIRLPIRLIATLG